MADKLYCIAVKSEKQLDAEILNSVDYIIYCPEEYSVKTVGQFFYQYATRNAQCAMADE